MKNVLVLVGFFLIISGCRESGTAVTYQFDDDNSIDTGAEIDSTGTITITDYTGKIWDITQAVEEFGFDPNHFRHGLGPYAIRPVLDPEFILNGDVDFPDENSDIVILGVQLQNESRAYALKFMVSHEVVNDNFGNLSFAPAY